MGRAARLVDPRGGLTTPLRGEETIYFYSRSEISAARLKGPPFSH